MELFLEDDKVCFKRYSSGCKDDIRKLIYEVCDDDYATYNKDRVLELLREAEQLMRE